MLRRWTTKPNDPLEGPTMIKNLFKKFRQDEDGAVTVDWVVLTAAVVALGTAGVTAMNTKITTKVSGITL
jgi:Flp pilus assembly pilin Flp